MTDLCVAFDRYDRENPQIYDMFKRFAFEAIKAGRKRLGAAMIIERMRWETTVAAQDDEFKINQNYAAFYSRKFMNEFPQYTGFFTTRASAADNTFPLAA